MDRRIIIISLLFLILSFRISNVGIYSMVHARVLSSMEFDQLEPARTKITDIVNSILPQPHAGLLSGIVFGLKSDLPDDFNTALKNTSTIHIVVASGENLTLLSAFLLSFSSFFGRRKLLIFSTVILTFYAMLTGFQLPILRALIMVFMVFLAQLVWRETDAWFVLGVTALLMLIYNPLWLFSISFQLSFLATVGVLIVAPEIEKLVKFLPDVIRQDLVATTCAQILTIPVIIINFHQLSVLSLLVNALVLWTVPIIMISGSFVLGIAIFSTTLGTIVALVPKFLLTYFIYVVTFFNQSWSIIYFDHTSMTLWAGYYIIIIASFLLIKRINSSNLAVTTLDSI